MGVLVSPAMRRLRCGLGGGDVDVWVWGVPWLDQGITLGIVVTERGEKGKRGGKANAVVGD